MSSMDMFLLLRGYTLTDRQLSECGRRNVPIDAVTALLKSAWIPQNKITDDLIEEICEDYRGEWSSKRAFAEREALNRFGKMAMSTEVARYFNYDEFTDDIFLYDYIFVEGRNTHYVFKSE